MQTNRFGPGRVLFAALAFGIVSSVASAAPIKWAVGDGGNGHSYEVVVVDGGILWNDAKVAAESAGGYLAVVTSTEESDFIYGLADPIDEVWDSSGINTLGPWLGGYQIQEGAWPWAWVTGETWSDTFADENWGSSQPSGNGDFLNIYGGGNSHGKQWNDYSDSVPGYVVEYVPEPGTIGLLTVGGLALMRRRRRRRVEE